MNEVDINAPSPIPLPRTPVPEAVDLEPKKEVQASMSYDEHKDHIAPLRTFSSDLAQAVREKGGSVVRIAIAEEEKHRREFEDQSITSKKNIAFILGGFVMVIGAIIFIVWGYIHKQNAAVQTPDQTAIASSIVNAENEQTVNASGMQIADLYGAINTIVATPDVQPGQIKNIIIAQGTGSAAVPFSASQLLTTLKTHAPDSFLRALSNDYMLGEYRYDRNNLFLIVHGTAHDFLLAGMLDWEPYLFDDMVPLFGIDTSSFTVAQLQSVPFTDAVVANRDVRVVLDANKKPLIFYSFLDQDTIIFTADAKTLTEVIRRF